MNPPCPGLDQLVTPDRLAAKEGHPRHRAFDVLERVRLSRLGDHEFGDVRLLATDARLIAPSLTTVPIGRS